MLSWKNCYSSKFEQGLWILNNIWQYQKNICKIQVNIKLFFFNSSGACSVQMILLDDMFILEQWGISINTQAAWSWFLANNLIWHHSSSISLLYTTCRPIKMLLFWLNFLLYWIAFGKYVYSFCISWFHEVKWIYYKLSETKSYIH